MKVCSCARFGRYHSLLYVVLSMYWLGNILFGISPMKRWLAGALRRLHYYNYLYEGESERYDGRICRVDVGSSGE